jgi:putative hydrolase of the HAD superfamily
LDHQNLKVSPVPKSSLIANHIRVIVFDAVGTLMYPQPSVAAVYVEVISRHTKTAIDGEKVRSSIRRALADRSVDVDQRTNEAAERDFWMNLIRDLCPNPAMVDVCFQDLFRHFAEPDSWKCFADCDGVLAELVRSGLTVVIGSNFDQRLHSVCDGLPPLMPAHHRVISSEIGWRKPAPEFFHIISEITQCRLEDILMIGDDLTNDVQGALAAGCEVLWIDREGTSNRTSEHLSSANQVPTIRSLQQLIKT